MKSLVVILALTGAAVADPCDEGRWRIAYGPKAKPIAIGVFGDAVDKPIYGAFTFVSLDDDTHRDVVFTSGCVRGIGESTRFHRVYASCGKADDRVEEYVLLYDEEIACSTKISLVRAKTQAKVGEHAWRDLTLTRTTPGKVCTGKTVETLRFDGLKYASSAPARVLRACSP